MIRLLTVSLACLLVAASHQQDVNAQERHQPTATSASSPGAARATEHSGTSPSRSATLPLTSEPTQTTKEDEAVDAAMPETQAPAKLEVPAKLEAPAVPEAQAIPEAPIKLSDAVEAAGKDAPVPAVTSAAPAAPPATAAPEGKIARWFELQTATLSTRHMFIENSSGLTTTNQEQYQGAFKGRFKFDKRGNYSINAGVFSGNRFVLSWNNTGVGLGDLSTNFYLKQLFFAAKPVAGLEVQYGGLYFLRGESTEITGYDNDGYLIGQRVSLKRPKQLFFDEISATYGYLGDTATPNINKRFHRLKKSNYHQFLVSKTINKRFAFSADYTFESGAETLREAVRITTKELRIIDSLRFDNYQRLDVQPNFGFNIYGEKTLAKRFMIGGGFARIDPDYGELNSDRLSRGKHFYVTTAFAITPEFTVSGFATEGLRDGFPISNRVRTEVIFSYNLLKSLQRTGIF